MATSRILYANYLTDLTPTISLFASGGAVAQSSATITTPIPYKSGFATMATSGTYTDIRQVLYRVEAHIAGSFAVARYRWSDTAGVQPYVWNAQNLTAVSGTPATLNRGVQITFTQQGAGTPQFALGDAWMFLGTLKHGIADATDDRRDTEWRSGTVPAASTIEYRAAFPSAVQPTAFALLDDNIPSNATVSLKLKNVDFTDPPTTTVPVTFQSGKKLVFLTTAAFTHWRICITCPTAPTLGYLRWSEIFLGPSLIFDQNFVQGFTREQRRLGAIDVDTLRRGPGPRLLAGDYLSLTYRNMSTADRTKLRTLWNWQHDAVHEVQRPFYVVPLDTTLSDFSLYTWTNDYLEQHQFNERSDSPVEWHEVIRSVA